jgi:hypothetical protein
MAQGDEEPLTTDRPGFGDSAYTVGDGVFQFETGYAFTDYDEYYVHDAGQLLLRYGLSDRLELRTLITSYIKEDGDMVDRSGWSHASLGLKYDLTGDRAGGKLALIVGTSIPSGIDFGATRTRLFGGLTGDWALSDKSSFSGSVLFNSLDESLTATAYYNRADMIGDIDFAIGYAAILNNDDLAVDRNGEVILGTRGEDEHLVDINAVFPLGPNSQFDIYAGGGLQDESANYFFGFGYARRF